MPGPIGQRLLIQVATVPRRSRATYAAAVDAAGLERSNMSHTRSTKKKIYPHHEAWAKANGYRPQASQAADVKPEDLHAANTQSFKPQANRPQAPSCKQQAPSSKPQA